MTQSKKLYRPYLTEDEILWILSQDSIPHELRNKLLKFQFSISHSIIKPAHTKTSQTLDEKLGFNTTQSNPLESIEVKRKLAYDKLISQAPVTNEEYEQAYHYMLTHNLFLNQSDKEYMEQKVFLNSMKGI